MGKILILLLFLLGQCFAGNYLSIRDTTIQVDRSFPLVIELTNTDSIIAFQFDVELPSSILYEDSFATTPRLQSFQVMANPIDSNMIRILCYSNGNNPIPGTSGAVILLSCRSGNEPGTFEVRLKNGVLADTGSRNVLDSLKNSIIKILTPTGIEIPYQDLGKENKQVYLFPNPFNGNLMMKYFTPIAQPVQIYLFNILGQVIYQEQVYEFQPGWNERMVRLSALSSGNYILGVRIGKKWIKQKITFIK